jgi:hypothetical protein
LAVVLLNIRKPREFFYSLLEQHSQGHLNLARASDGFIDDSQTGWRIVERLPYDREIVVELVLGYIVDGDIKAAGVGQVENVERCISAEIALGELGVTFTKEIWAALCHDWRKMLRWPLVKLVSKVSLAGNRSVEISGLKQGQGEAGSLERRVAISESSGGARDRILCACSRERAGTIGLVMPSKTL